MLGWCRNVFDDQDYAAREQTYLVLAFLADQMDLALAHFASHPERGVKLRVLTASADLCTMTWLPLVCS